MAAGRKENFSQAVQHAVHVLFLLNLSINSYNVESYAVFFDSYLITHWNSMEIVFKWKVLQRPLSHVRELAKFKVHNRNWLVSSFSRSKGTTYQWHKNVLFWLEQILHLLNIGSNHFITSKPQLLSFWWNEEVTLSHVEETKLVL